MGVGVTIIREFTMIAASPEVLHLLEQHQSDAPAAVVSLDGEAAPAELVNNLQQLAQQGDDGARLLLQELERTGAINAVIIY